jgi:hypothetical protein
MTRDDIIRMAREAATEDGSVNRDDGKDVVLYAAKTTLFLERFAALVEQDVIDSSMPAIKLLMAEERKNGAREERVACEELWEKLRIKDDQIRQVIEASVAVEREACAQIALQWDKEHPSTNFGGCIARSIRERGQA